MAGFTHSIAGGNGNLVIDSFQSPGFEAGVQGWQVTKDGDAEFNNADIRGVVTATEFDATIIVSAGIYAGTYVVALDELTDADGNRLAVLSWQNETNPGTVPAYVAAVTSGATGSGSLANLTSGQADPGDFAAAVWVLSAEANDGSNSQFLVDAAQVALFGGAGPVMVEDSGGFDIFISGDFIGGFFGDAWVAAVPVVAVTPGTEDNETWHAITLDSGWSVPSGRAAPQYRLLPDGNVQFAGAASRTSFTNTSVNLNGSNPLPAGYRPGSVKIYRGFSNSDAGQAAIEYNTTGVLTARAVGSGITAGGNPNAEVDGIVSLL